MKRPTNHPHSHRTKPPPNARSERLKRLLLGWRFELDTLLLFALGIFLLIEQYNIRATLWRMSKAVVGTATGAVRAIVDSIAHTTPSDLTGMLLVVLSVGLVIWRFRHRLRTSPRWTSSECPMCGDSLHRSHRRLQDHFFNRIVPVRRYRCVNPECGWSGLRVKPIIRPGANR